MINDLRKKTVDELKKIEEESRAELFALRFQSSFGNLEKPHRINELKKTVARILTVINEKLSLGETLTVKNIKIDLAKVMEKAEKATKTFKKEEDESKTNVAAEQQQLVVSLETSVEEAQNDIKPLTAAKQPDKLDKEKSLKQVQTVSKLEEKPQAKKNPQEQVKLEETKKVVEQEESKKEVQGAKKTKTVKVEQPVKAKPSSTSSNQQTKTVAKSTASSIKPSKTIVEETKSKQSGSSAKNADAKKTVSKTTTKEPTSSSSKTSVNASNKDDEPFEEAKVVLKKSVVNSDKKDVDLKKEKSLVSELREQSLTTIHGKVINKITAENQSKVKAKVEKVQKTEVVKKVVEVKSITDAKATFDAKEIDKIAKGNVKAKKKAEETALDRLERIKNKTAQTFTPADGKCNLDDIKLNVKAKPKNAKAYTYGKQLRENSESIKEISQKRIGKTLGKKKEVK